MKKILYVLIDKKDLTKKFYKKVDLFTLNEFVITEFEKKNFNHFFPNPKETSILSESLIYKIKEIKIEIYKKIRDLYIFNQIEDLNELIEPFLEAKISRFYYLKNSIPNYKKYIFLGNRKNNVFYSKIDLIFVVDKTYTIEDSNNRDFTRYFLLCVASRLLCVLLQLFTRLDDYCACNCGNQNKSNEYNHCTYTD